MATTTPPPRARSAWPPGGRPPGSGSTGNGPPGSGSTGNGPQREADAVALPRSAVLAAAVGLLGYQAVRLATGRYWFGALELLPWVGIGLAAAAVALLLTATTRTALLAARVLPVVGALLAGGAVVAAAALVLLATVQQPAPAAQPPRPARPDRRAASGDLAEQTRELPAVRVTEELPGVPAPVEPDPAGAPSAGRRAEPVSR